MSSESLKTLEQDLAELKKLLEQAGRKRSQDLLNGEILKVTTAINDEKAKLEKKLADEEESKTSDTKPLGEKNLNFITITKYSWDQESDRIKIYLSLEGIGKVEKDHLHFNATDKSVDLQIFGYKNQNHRFGVRQLEEKIDPSKSKMTQKENTVIINLKKEKNKTWDNLEFKENKLKSKKPDMGDMGMGSGGGDPSSSLMDMMKNLYETGDDNMKKTIAEAWTKSRDDKNPGGGLGGF